jgi:hypothetical protein
MGLCNLSFAQISNSALGVIPNGSGVNLSVGSQGTNLSLNNVPWWLNNVATAATSAAQEAKATTTKNADGSMELTAENTAKLEAAKTKFLTEKKDLITESVINGVKPEQLEVNKKANNKTIEQETIRIGQELNNKPDLTTKDIAVWNKTSINQIEYSAKQNLSEKYNNFQ